MWWLCTGLALAGAYEEGVQALVRGEAEAAKSALDRAVTEQPEAADAWWELGWAHWLLEDFPAAALAWERAGSLDDERTEAAFWVQSARTRADWASAELGPVELPLEADAGESLRVAAVGDTMLGSDLRGRLPPGDGSDLLASVWEPLREADVAFANLETTLADGLPSTKCGPESSNCYAFRTPTRYTAALQEAGIDLVSHANNHAFDLGEAGMLATAAALDAAGIAHAGRYGDAARLEIQGRRVVLLAAHSGACCLNVNEVEELQRAVRRADERADLVLLSFHGGAEGPSARHVPGEVEVAWGESRGDVRALARAAVDAGADLVLGHGPHVLRAMEVYKGRLIAYSLGNFVGYRQFGTRGGPGGRSVILEAELAPNGVLRSARLLPLALNGQGVAQPDPTGAALEDVRELSAADFPDTGVRIEAEGQLSWGPTADEGSDRAP